MKRATFVISVNGSWIPIWLSFFDCNNQKGDQYKPDNLSVNSMQHQSVFFFWGGGVEKDSTISIIEDREFKHAWDVLLSNRKLLKQQGKGNKDRKEDPFTQHEIDILYSNNFLGGIMLVYFQAW